MLSSGQTIFLALVGVWLIFSLAGMYRGNLAAKRRHVERLAMIEKGLTPPPDPDPTESGLSPAIAAGRQAREPNPHRGRDLLAFFRVGSILLAGVAGGLGLLLYLLNDRPAVAFAISGLIGSIALAFFIVSNRGIFPSDPMA